MPKKATKFKEEMKMFKKTLALLLALVMVLGLAACTAKPVETQAPTNAPEAGNDPVETTEAPAADPVKITIYYPDSLALPSRLTGWPCRRLLSWLTLKSPSRLSPRASTAPPSTWLWKPARTPPMSSCSMRSTAPVLCCA